MNKRRIKAVIKALEAGEYRNVLPGGFGFNSEYRHNDAPEGDEIKPWDHGRPCAEVGDVVRLARLMFKKVHEWGFTPNPFDLPYAEANKLIFGQWCYPLGVDLVGADKRASNASPTQVAAVLRNLLKTGTIDWKEAGDGAVG